MLRQKINQILDELPEQELEIVYSTIVWIQEEYEYKQNLMNKGVILDDFFEGAEDIVELWENAFVSSVNEETKLEIHYEQFKWHLFSFGKLPCLKEEAARNAFNHQLKNDLYIFYQNAPFTFICKKAECVVASDFDSQQDIYICDTSFTWTYVHTHEDMCGPYFYTSEMACK
ncbi:DUF4275 family protein [Lysinibacillus sp. NPDC096418]|uniref:DUF4275 family protein n=1 Tax=Lysinibacillus sp. NPDC096418 TaxID=3364138 RepID=UPI00382C5F85